MEGVNGCHFKAEASYQGGLTCAQFHSAIGHLTRAIRKAAGGARSRKDRLAFSVAISSVVRRVTRQERGLLRVQRLR